MKNMFPETKTNRYNIVQIIFLGRADGTSILQIFGSTRKIAYYNSIVDENDDTLPIAPLYAPDYPNSYLAGFYSKEEIANIIKIIASSPPQTQSLDNAFK